MRVFIFKLKQIGISGKVLSDLSDFLKDRKQKVILNGQVSSYFLRTGANAGVPQGSILGPLHFFLHCSKNHVS